MAAKQIFCLQVPSVFNTTKHLQRPSESLQAVASPTRRVASGVVFTLASIGATFAEGVSGASLLAGVAAPAGRASALAR